jgi:hypothetical protein
MAIRLAFIDNADVGDIKDECYILEFFKEKILILLTDKLTRLDVVANFSMFLNETPLVWLCYLKNIDRETNIKILNILSHSGDKSSIYFLIKLLYH